MSTFVAIECSTITKGNTVPTNMELNSLIEPVTADRHVHEAVGRKIDECPYGSIFKKVSWRYAEGQLTLFGYVPSFYLKQVLQELMRDIDQVEQIVNHVDVINASGLSSESPTNPNCRRLGSRAG
jgi:hypothetical protein